jgi:hypothetical protein
VANVFSYKVQEGMLDKKKEASIKWH